MLAVDEHSTAKTVSWPTRFDQLLVLTSGSNHKTDFSQVDHFEIFNVLMVFLQCSTKPQKTDVGGSFVWFLQVTGQLKSSALNFRSIEYHHSLYLNFGTLAGLWPWADWPSLKIEILGFFHHHHEISDPYIYIEHIHASY
jgi:hypothetical protein